MEKKSPDLSFPQNFQGHPWVKKCWTLRVSFLYSLIVWRN